MLLVLLALTACAPATPAATRAGPAERPAAPKVLTIAIQREPNILHRTLTTGVPSVGGVNQTFHIPHDYLVVANDTGGFQPVLALENIALDRGTWRVNPDGSMETTWKLHPNAKWHDGTPFTAEDMVFSLQVYKDPEIPNGIGRPLAFMASASAPDPHTFTIHWSETYVQADDVTGLIPMPRHLLAEQYATDKANFPNSTRFTTDFVGLGPYKLVRWEPGSHLEFSRFDEYYRGRPQLDTVLVRFITDPNAMVAAILAGTVDVLLPIGVDLDAALEVQKRWEGTGNQVILNPSGRLRHLELQHRLEFMQPRNGFVHAGVRQAFFGAIDRRTLVDVITQGAAPIADSYYQPTHELRPLVESAIPQFRTDLAAAQRLLAEQGWARGADGTLVHQSDGERFEILLYGSNSPFVEKEQNVIADGWKALGAQVNFHIIPTALGGDREYRSKLPGAGLNGAPSESFYTGRLHSRTITSPASRWNGDNRGGYSDPRVDALLDRIAATIPLDQRLPLHHQLLAIQIGEVALMPLYWDIDPALALKSVRGVAKKSGSVATWNMWEWDKV